MLRLPATSFAAGPRALNFWLDRSTPTLLVLSQVYVPDPAAVGQHMHDAAVEMHRRGHRVVVITSDRGYEDPTRAFPHYERLDDVDVVRVPWSSFGKTSIPVRLAGGTIFVSEAVALAASMARIDRILVSTSPPMCALAGLALSRLRGAAVTFWAMDINPDQIVATGAVDRDALAVRAFDWMNRRILARARRVVALDRFMAERLETKWPVSDKLSVVPPWPPIDVPDILPHAFNPFRGQQGWDDKFVVMYSGNLSPVHPVSTILDAALRVQDDTDIVFAFVGGGSSRTEIDRYVCEHALSNVCCLPYQPIATLRNSLSAADAHLVAMGNDMVGIVHPSKIYGAMAVGRPILALGPRRSHIAEIVRTHDIGFQIEHGDVDGAERALRALAALSAETRDAMGRRAHAAVRTHYARSISCGRFCDLLEASA